MPPTDMADEAEGFKKGTPYFSVTNISTTLGVIKNILNTTSAIEFPVKYFTVILSFLIVAYWTGNTYYYFKHLKPNLLTYSKYRGFIWWLFPILNSVFLSYVFRDIIKVNEISASKYGRQKTNKHIVIGILIFLIQLAAIVVSVYHGKHLYGVNYDISHYWVFAFFDICCSVSLFLIKGILFNSNAENSWS